MSGCWVLACSTSRTCTMLRSEMTIYYCCCDISYLVLPCVVNLADLDVAACTSECEPYFEMSFKVCLANGTCSNTKKGNAVTNSIVATYKSPLLVQLHSEESMIVNITNVSANKHCYCVFSFIIYILGNTICMG